VVWIGTVFSEFIGPFNVLRQPIGLSVVAWAFWAVCALMEGYAIAVVTEAGSAKQVEGAASSTARHVRQAALRAAPSPR
jgi:hypothetical protein